ncbi:MAG TPA: DUF2171 domain-containing protein [Woeseiaceae bacterium]|nr:DUF2171 domain-containing protein [Woeseiaceae bacterium]
MCFGARGIGGLEDLLHQRSRTPCQALYRLEAAKADQRAVEQRPAQPFGRHVGPPVVKWRLTIGSQVFRHDRFLACPGELQHEIVDPDCLRATSYRKRSSGAVKTLLGLGLIAAAVALPRKSDNDFIVQALQERASRATKRRHNPYAQLTPLYLNPRHAGTVDHVEGTDQIKLTRTDEDAGGQHHYIPLAWVSSVDGDRVRLDKPAAEAERNWRTAP